jgi:hypothetical protein
MPGFFGNFKPPPFNRFHAAAHTVSFTGRDAANYTTILIKMEPLVGLAPSLSRQPPYGFTKPALWLLRHKGF